MRRASLLALASSLEATAAELTAKAATIRAAIEAAVEAPRDTVTLADAVRLLGNKRRAREFFRRAESAGFKVVSVGHAVTMARDEWDRACDALRATNRTGRKRPPREDDSPAALLARAGLVAGAPPKRAA
jgi:hypothetical protein